MEKLLAAIIFIQILGSISNTCPPLYLRYSKEHSFCKPKNSSCQILKSKLTDDMRKQVLDLHNKYRSQVAMGKEKRAGGLPKAANMMQMVWDTELEAVVQKHLEQCNYKHDCSNCRQVENFRVGQNLYKKTDDSPPDWNNAIKLFYDEVIYTNSKIINSFKSASALGLPKEKSYGHFTQLIWANSWRLGCGHVMFKTEKGHETLLGCNYGPAGNSVGEPVYKVGDVCTACPINSFCGKSSKKLDYDGLCKMNNNEFPLYADFQKYMFYCDFRNSDGDCSATFDGPKWRYVNALGGSFAEIVLQQGESSTLVFKNSAKPKGKIDFCISVKYRSGPAVERSLFNNVVDLNFIYDGTNDTEGLNKVVDSSIFESFQISYFHVDDMKVSLTFSVPKGVPPQFLNVALVNMYDGECTE